MKKNSVLNFNELERRGMAIIDIYTDLGMALSILKSDDEDRRRDKFGDCSNCTSNDCMGCKYYG